MPLLNDNVISTLPTNQNDRVITAVQKQYYERDGFLILQNFISETLCAFLIESAMDLINEFNPDSYKTIFSTKDQQHAKSNYFLDSGDKIHFFFEENAFDHDGNLVVDKRYAINKIGHALHDVDPRFYCFSRLHKIASLARDLNLTNPTLIQSMYICKQPFIGGEVTCHQDSTYLYVHEQPIVGLWFALQDATLENGCLWAIPGGHRMPLKSRMKRVQFDRIETEVYDDSPWPLERMIPLAVPAGSVIVLNGLLPHMSKENKSNQSRHAYTLHISSGSAGFARDNWLKRDENNPFSSFL